MQEVSLRSAVILFARAQKIEFKNRDPGMFARIVALSKKSKARYFHDIMLCLISQFKNASYRVL